MKRTILILCVVMAAKFSIAQKEETKLYNPEADAKQELIEAVVKANKENKHVFVMVGFNECSWCHLFHKFIKNDAQIDSLINANFVPLKINYSGENKNMEVMKYFEYPNRFGFPVFVILNEKGRRIHTQNSAYLEEGRGYNKKEVMRFFKQWSPAALDDGSYK